VVQNAKEEHQKVAECIERMQNEVSFCVQQSYEEVSELVKQEIGV
jgi:hypothetical protein